MKLSRALGRALMCVFCGNNTQSSQRQLQLLKCRCPWFCYGNVQKIRDYGVVVGVVKLLPCTNTARRLHRATIFRYNTRSVSLDMSLQLRCRLKDWRDLGSSPCRSNSVHNSIIACWTSYPVHIRVSLPGIKQEKDCSRRTFKSLHLSCV